MKVFVTLLMLGFMNGFISCDKTEFPGEELLPVYGGWNLFATSGGFSGGYYLVEENSERIAITPEGEYYEYHYDYLIAEKDFEIEAVEGTDGNGAQYYLEFTDENIFSEDFPDVFHITMNGTDTLIISFTGCNDCLNYHYARNQ